MAHLPVPGVTLRRAWLVLALVAATSAAAAPARADDVLSSYSLTSWSDGSGRPLGSVYAIAQADDGYLWIGADAGLIRFDGWRFVPWDTMSDVPIPGSIKAVTVARGGGLWVGSANPAGVSRLRDGRLQQYTEGLEGLESVTAVAEDGTGTAWAIVDWELYTRDGGRWRRVALPWKTRSGPVREMFVGRTGTVWVGTRWGVFEQIPGSSAFRLVSDEHVWGIGEDDTGRIWTTDVAAGFRQLGAGAAPPHQFEAAGYRLLHDRTGTLWLGTFGDGLWRVRTTAGRVSIERAALRTGLSSNSVLAIMEDRDGNVWVGTTAGLHRLTRRALTPLQDVGFVLAVQPWGTGGVLAGTTTGLARLSRSASGWQSYHIGDASPEIRSFYHDPRGMLWIGATNGLWRLDGNRLSQVPLPAAAEMLVLTISPAPNGDLWLGDGQWIYRWDGRVLTPLTLAADARIKTITFAKSDRTGRLWLGSGKDIGFIDASGHLEVLEASDGLAPDAHLTLHDVLDDDHGVWLATSTGLSRFEQGRVTSVGRTQGLPGDHVWAIVEDLKNDLWLTLDRGMARMARADVVRAMADPAHRLRYQLYDPTDGLAGAALGTINSAREADGRLWFVRGGGVTEVQPAQLAPRSGPPTVRIEEAIANDSRLDLSQRSLPAGTRRLSLSFTALTLTPSNRVRLRYRLDGFDTGWVDAGPRRTAFYTNLSPREYRFRVEAHSEDGSFESSATDWTFAIQPAIYQTGWFYTAVALLVAGCIVLAWRFRVALMRRQFSLALAERARLSREIHDTLLQSLVGVALQFDGIANALGPSSVAAREQLTRIRRQVEAYIREARQSIWDLRSPILETHDLAAALRAFARETIGDRAIRFTSAVSGNDTARPPKIDNQLLRIGQEALTNAVRHADARRIHLDIAFDEHTVTLRVTDDGRGFDADRSPSRDSSHHYGLTTMKERAEELGGTLTITTAEGGGTTIEAAIPLSAQTRDSLPAAI